MSVFRKIWHALFSWNTRFEIGPFALLPTDYDFMWLWFHRLHGAVRGKSINSVTSKSTTSAWISIWQWNRYIWKSPYKGIITRCFKVSATAPWKVRAIFCRGLDFFILQSSVFDKEQNEKPKSIFILVTKLINWDKKQTRTTKYLT